MRRLAVAVLLGALVAAPLAAQRGAANAAPGAAHYGATVAAAEVAARRGEWNSAIALASEVAGAYKLNGTSWSVPDLIAAGRAFTVLGARDPQYFHDALQAFDRASARDSSNTESRLRAADLLLDKYNAPDATSSYREVLAIAPGNAHALLGLARVLKFNGDGGATGAVRASIAADSLYAPARVLLAQLHLGAEAFDSATVQARRAVALDSTSVDGWAVLGAIAWLRGDSTAFRADRAAAEAVAPHSAVFFTDVADAAANQRRYDDAVTLAALALRADSLSARALGLLGENELRTGAMHEGRADLERSFALDPYNLWHKNMLDLLDHVQKFKTVRTARFELVAPPAEADYLALYLGPLLEAAYDTFAVRYGYRPTTPIRVELYDRHADFSVRTVGLTGLGALGVCFGPVIVLDSPRARELGELNYGSTAWHELAHTFTLGLSNHRVPRWISEGLSVLEERRAGHGWGANVSADFLAVYKGGALPKASQINEGLVRPKFGAEIGLSYYEASLVLAMVEKEHGIAAIRAMLKGYADGLDTPGVLRQQFNLTPEAFDAHFDSWLRARFATALAAIDSSDGQHPVTGRYLRLVDSGATLLKGGDGDAAGRVLRQAQALFPDDGTADGPAWLLAHADRDAGNLRDAISQVHVVTMHSETAYEADTLEAGLNVQIGDSTAALAALERAQWIDPYDGALHLRIAALSEQLKAYPMAVRERRAIVALDPPDPLEARYQLARVLNLSGDRDGARHEILMVLEQAPAFEKAQALLLELQGGHT
jgi:tetratricopeptide (TPR) repeat protein